jgi:hypothetical protein
MWITTARQCISPEVTVMGFKKCCIPKRQMICCGMAVKGLGMLTVSVRKMKALTVKIETVMLIDSGKQI